MKALILILVAAACAAAQQLPTVADVARQERARRTQSRSSRTYTTEDIRTTPPAETPEQTSAPNATPAQAAPTADAAAGAAAAEPSQEQQDPVQQWLLENEARREELRRLRDQELEAQLQVNTATNQLNAPISTQSAKDEAAANLQAAQLNLKGIRDRIAKSQSELEARELQGPPKK